MEMGVLDYQRGRLRNAPPLARNKHDSSAAYKSQGLFHTVLRSRPLNVNSFLSLAQATVTDPDRHSHLSRNPDRNRATNWGL